MTDPQNHEINQSPLCNLSDLEFFNLKITPKNNQEWEKYIDDFLLFKFSYFRLAFIENRLESMAYFLNLLEGNYVVLKSAIIVDCLGNIKREMIPILEKERERREIEKEKEKNNKEKVTEKVEEVFYPKETFVKIQKDYINLVNLTRILAIWLIQHLLANKIKLNNDNIIKFMKHDSELDGFEKEGIRDSFVKFGTIKNLLPQDGSKVDYMKILKTVKAPKKEEEEGCVIF